MKDFYIREALWSEDRTKCYSVRKKVFIEEQLVPEEIEIDEDDPACFHVLALTHKGDSIATGRLQNNGRIGRIAVLKEWRRRGVGKAIMDFLEKTARDKGLPGTLLHSQLSAINFYASLGYEEEGDVYYEANIPHITMRKKL